jgi:hypothetical protein
VPRDHRVGGPLRALLALLLAAFPACAADSEEIVRRAGAAIQSDWDLTSNFADIEGDEVEKDGKTTSKTFQVVMIAGSDYYLPAAIDDRPLSPDETKSELEKLRNEVRRRDNESPDARRDRVEHYRRQRAENGALLLEFPKAFSFELLREEVINGHAAYVLAAAPRTRTGPLSRAAKVLAGTRGTLWVDKETFHPIRAEGTAFTSVPVFGILAHVLQGTHLEFELAPVNDSTWLISQLSMELRLSKFFFFRSTRKTRSVFSNYRPNAEVLAQLLADSHVE